MANGSSIFTKDREVARQFIMYVTTIGRDTSRAHVHLDRFLHVPKGTRRITSINPGTKPFWVLLENCLEMLQRGSMVASHCRRQA
tara:strand:+ start:31 stop:285 length:255 start_codon:yes stop_codon:yes gene_type:complete